MRDIHATVGEYFDKTKEVESSSLKILDEVRVLCEKNKCGNYNKSWNCPPAVGTLDEIKEEFTKFPKLIIFYEIYTLKNNMDWEGMIKGIETFDETVTKLQKDLSKDRKNKEDFIILGSAGCKICERCAYLDGEPCRFPDDVTTSAEACGVDCMSLMKDNGLPYNNGPETVTYIGCVLY